MVEGQLTEVAPWLQGPPLLSEEHGWPSTWDEAEQRGAETRRPGPVFCTVVVPFAIVAEAVCGPQSFHRRSNPGRGLWNRIHCRLLDPVLAIPDWSCRPTACTARASNTIVPCSFLKSGHSGIRRPGQSLWRRAIWCVWDRPDTRDDWT